ncbi:MAG: 3-hydroxyacyl-CoA dehydrogenase NAD-binding domain-containing protein [Desulfatiglandales bacterium]|jgi:3-hydroxybutyryl-CoA dehydrogenase|nr:3-hydroxyacyl-CoA dehydrogenase NAD-binding domain-containing protein [Desulfatiglandales bacterium]
MSKVENIAVVGAGLMGHGIAQIFAVRGYAVTLMDLRDELLSGAIENIRSNLTLMAQRGVGQPGDIEGAIKRIRTAVGLKRAAEGAQFVVEAVTENLELKQKIFQDLDSVCPPDTILATNTSVISITEIAQKARNPERILGTHFWNPPYLIPLVEVIRGQETGACAMDTTVELLKGLGKHPVRVNKDVPGFVGNRLQHALWREAISIVERGIADPSTVDECIKYGFGLRLPVLGPLETADMVGTDLTLAIHDYILKYIEGSPEPSPLLKKKVEKGDLGFKTGRGFQDWTPEETQRSRTNLQEYLLKVTKT